MNCLSDGRAKSQDDTHCTCSNYVSFRSSERQSLVVYTKVIRKYSNKSVVARQGIFQKHYTWRERTLNEWEYIISPEKQRLFFVEKTFVVVVEMVGGSIRT